MELKRLLDEIIGSDSDEELLDVLRKHYVRNVLPGVVAAAAAAKDGRAEVLLNNDGSARKVNRMDYSRRQKAKKPGNPWEICNYLKLIRHADTHDPTSPQGKEFRAKFRVPLPIFEDIVKMLRDTNEPEFNYQENCVGGEYSIPLELKTLAALRVLACGAGFSLVSDACGFMSSTTCNAFFKDFVRLFRLHYEEKFIHPLEGARLEGSMGVYAKLGLPGCVGSIDVSCRWSIK